MVKLKWSTAVRWTKCLGQSFSNNRRDEYPEAAIVPMALPVEFTILPAVEVYDSISGHTWFELIFRIVE